ncbi:sigma 54-interacting transcriptional regulator [Sporosalibacterium faouarense]|uniref:sigma 54-interacting transcriptional regulator n=1 Tax=Sporosalibacterium faouarense TaxID=516123 RepID=UPI00141C76E5|nr:sigma 54-interacting transcriptional regulator [Sporosalibacterium faouarense]MTI49277.1 PAS domain-containing protein [Bacillota bacterium]
MDLIKIESSVQNISEAISSVIMVDVTIVDDKFRRIAGTGKYKNRVGEAVSEDSAFGFALRRGESFIIEDPGSHSACLKCKGMTNCKEYAEVCCPINASGKIAGVIGLIAFEEKQRQAIINNKSNLMKFLNRMADLISSKLLERENTEKIKLLAKEIEVVLNSVDTGIIAVNCKGDILRLNKKALELFAIEDSEISNTNIKNLIGNYNLSSLIRDKKGVKNREFTYKSLNHSFRGVFNTSPIRVGEENLGIVFMFNNISDVLNTVNNITNSTIITSLDSIIGNSKCIEKVKIEAEKAAKSTSTVFIQGESGTGKELFARAIHYHSNRSNKPFIPINCAAIPEQLLESELFGYEDGAFTGAKRGGKAGKFELANEGTIFLDEIGDMPIHLQAKLLRVLQDKAIEKVGGKDFIPVDVRVVAATNKDLEQKVSDGEFREDLFYRLNVIPLNIPPLKDRKDDIDVLVKYLLKKCSNKLEKEIDDIDEALLFRLKEYDWPGNVRELENTMEYAVSMCNENIIKEEHLPNRLRKDNSLKIDKSITQIKSIKELEKHEIEKALKYYGDTKKSMEKASNALGIGRATLYRKIKEYGIK